jgi:nuclear pore complex protein Nup160
VSWDDKGTISCDTIAMEDLFQFSTYTEPRRLSPLLHDWQRSYDSYDAHTLDAAYFDNLLGLDAPEPAEPFDNSDITNTFLIHLLHPGRFSQLSLQTALDEYIEQLPQQASTLAMIRGSYPTLGRKYAAIVGCNLEMTESEETGAPVVDVYRRQLKLEWLGIWSNVRDLDRQSRWPVVTAVVDDHFVILTREGLTLPVPEDSAGLATLFSGVGSGEIDEFRELPEGAISKLYPALSSVTGRNDILAISAAGSSLSSSLPLDALGSFTEQVNAELAQGLQQPVEILGMSLWDEHPEMNLSEDARTGLRRSLSDCDEISRGFVAVLELLADLSMALGGTALQNASTSGTAKALITANISQIVATRYTLSRNVLLVILFALSESDTETEDEDSEQLRDILVRSLVLYHRYRILKWVTEQTGEEAKERNQLRSSKGIKRFAGDENQAQGLGGLKVRDGNVNTDGFDSDGYDLQYSLLHSLFARQFELPTMSGSLNSVLSTSMEFLDTADVIPLDEESRVELRARGQDLQLIQAVLMDGHCLLASKMSELYEFGSGVAYVRGRSWVESGDWEAGAGLLQRAAAGCRGTFLPLPRISDADLHRW